MGLIRCIAEALIKTVMHNRTDMAIREITAGRIAGAFVFPAGALMSWFLYRPFLSATLSESRFQLFGLRLYKSAPLI
ncbi:hypothetical protein U2P60_11020 [Brucella sp. H1_1004]|uniref:hypothetical protein n=1 Tax=Brucella sp. H1_1004 TaxID=3110109 RepID=UPI0039B63E95